MPRPQALTLLRPQDVAGEFLAKDRSAAGLRKDEFWANQGISFELRRGECLGLIGKNGAGKTTLLKMLNGLIKPDTGTIEMRGRAQSATSRSAEALPLRTRSNEAKAPICSSPQCAKIHSYMKTWTACPPTCPA